MPSEGNRRLFAYEGPVRLGQAFVPLDGRERGIRRSLERYSEEIVDSLLGPDRRGFVLGLLGEWGSGKTSAMLILLGLVAERLAMREELKGLTVSSEPVMQEPLASAVTVADAGGTEHFLVTSSVLRAPLSLQERSADDARLDLAQAILLGLPPQMHQSIADWLRPGHPSRGADSPSERLEIAQFLRKELSGRTATGTEIEQWIRDARAAYLTSATEAKGQGAEFLRRNVHIVMLDDLDRAPLPYTAQILNAVRFWVDTEGMFFVIAASPDYLREAAMMAMPTDAEGWSAGEPAKTAVQKFLHHELHIPTLLETVEDVARYWRILLEASANGFTRLQNGSRDLIEEALDSSRPLGVLAPLLSPRVVDQSRPRTPLPREAKRNYNALIGEVSSLPETAGVQELKRNVAALAWRDAWENFVYPALTEEKTPGAPDGPRATALATGLGLAKLALRDSTEDDLDAAVDKLRRLAKSALFDLAGVPPTLLLYLASDPPFTWSPQVLVGGDRLAPSDARESETAEAGRPPLRSGQEEGRSSEPGDAGLGFQFRDTRYEREATEIAQSLSLAATAGDLQAARRLTAQFRELLDKLDVAADARQTAPAIGNAALRLESRDTELAWELHSLAHFLNPDHANIRLNLADFLLDYARGDSAWGEVQRQLDWVAANAPGERPERQLGLRARLAQARGDEPGRRELVQQLLDLVSRPNVSFGDVAYAVNVLGSKMKDRQGMERFVRHRLERRLPEDQGSQTYRLLRLLGDELIEETGELEARGVDILRHLLAVDFCPDDQAVADVLNNLAIIYNTRRNPQYEELARLLWLHAIRLAPEDRVIRQAYGRFLERRDVDTARRLQLGQTTDVPQPGPGEVRQLAATLPPHMSEGPWWWEDFLPPEPARGMAELARPDPQQPAGADA